MPKRARILYKLIKYFYFNYFYNIKIYFYYRKNTDYFDLLENCEINSGEISLNDDRLDSMHGLSLSQIIALIKIKNTFRKEDSIYENRKMLIDQNDYFSLWIHQIKRLLLL